MLLWAMAVWANPTPLTPTYRICFYSQHLWHQMDAFSTADSPVLCRYQLSVLQFSSILTLTTQSLWVTYTSVQVAYKSGVPKTPVFTYNNLLERFNRIQGTPLLTSDRFITKSIIKDTNKLPKRDVGKGLEESRAQVSVPWSQLMNAFTTCKLSEPLSLGIFMAALF